MKLMKLALVTRYAAYDIIYVYRILAEEVCL